MRRGSRPFPGKPQGAASPTPPTPRGGLRRRPSPGYHPRRLPLPPTPAEGSRPLPTDRTIEGCSRQPPGRACPAPTVRRPGNGCPRKPRGRFHIPIRRAGCPHPAATSRCRQQQPLPSPLGEGGPAGPDEGQAPAAARPRATHRGRRPRRPAEACAAVLPWVTTRGDSRCRQHPRRGQDPSLRTEPLRGAHANPRAGHARPLPCGGPGTGARVNPAGVSISPSVGRGAPTPPRPPAAARPRANRRGRRPRRPAKPCANGHPPGNHPQTFAHANPRAGHARPLPGDNPAHLYTT